MPPGNTKLCYRDLEAWQKAMDLAEAVYSVCRKLPEQERFGLASQLQRAAVSIPSNIAEGQGRKHRKDFCRFLLIARGSLMELETQLLLSERLKYASKAELQPVWDLSQQVGRLLGGLVRAMEKDPGRVPHVPATSNQQPATEVLP
ncbi:MAG TPA: four helix bundle protein [Planctomycetota bacterium]|nr:four helix bundle protein [Planctomycetota bacterium]